MAEIALNFLLQKLSALCAEEEMKLHGGIEREVNELKYELESMIAMLQDADARGGIVDERVKRWVQSIRDVVYDTEDVLDEFFVRFARPQKQQGRRRIINSLANKLGDMKHLKNRHTLATKLQGIKKKIRHLSEILKNSGCTTGIGEEGSSTADTRDAAPLVFFDEADLVGIDEPKDLLIRWLTEGEEDQSKQLKMISVVGMGGLGKTTLVMNVYDSQIVKRHFDCHAWITVSKSFVIRELLQTAITGVLESTKELAPPQMMGQMKEDELIQMLKSYLRRKRWFAFDQGQNTVGMEKMIHLNSLRIISSADNDEFLQLGPLSSPPELLLHLYLVGPLMALPYWIASLRNLVCLVLQESYLDVDPLKAFPYMPSLVFLELGLAYKGRELCCEVGGYPKLKKLRLYMLEHLKRVRFMERSMPSLRRLTIENCPTLKMVPQGIEKLMDLQELVLGKMLPGFVDRVRRPQGEDCWKVKHILTIKHAYEIQGIWDVENLR